MLKGDKIYLRPLKLEDANYTLSLRYDLDSINSLMGYPFPVNLDCEIEWIRSLYSKGLRDKIYLGIIDQESQEFVGYLSLQNINYIDRVGEFGIIIDKKYRGKGFAKEAISLFLDYLNKNFAIRKVTLKVFSDNLIAIELYKKLGFEIEGKLIKHSFSNSIFKDVLIMSKFLAME